MDDKEQFSWPSRLARYFLHGIAFSILLLLLGLVWVIILVMLVVVGALIGLKIGVIVLFFFIVGLNTVLTDFIWSTTIESGWKTLLIHGLGLFFALFFVDLPGYIYLASSGPSPITLIGLIVVCSFIDGFMAKNVASLWEEGSGYGVSERAEAMAESTTQESALKLRTEEVDAQSLYDKLLAEYIQHWGAKLGTELLDNEIKAHTWHRDTFEEDVRRVYERQRRESAK
ncbi:MAG: hypothetical protein ABSB28_07580 [Candidatus Bathyarchaeia archaeon]